MLNVTSKVSSKLIFWELFSGYKSQNTFQYIKFGNIEKPKEANKMPPLFPSDF